MTSSLCPLPWWPLQQAPFHNNPFFCVLHLPCPLPLIPLPPHYIFPAFYLYFSFTWNRPHNISITFPLPPCTSHSPAYAQYSCLNLYHGPVGLLTPLLWSCCLTSYIALLNYFHLYCGPVALISSLPWPCSLMSTYIMNLLTYFRLYCGPVPLLPPVPYPRCLTIASTMAPLYYIHLTISLLHYFHLLHCPVTLLPPLPWPCYHTSTSTVSLLHYFHQ